MSFSGPDAAADPLDPADVLRLLRVAERRPRGDPRRGVAQRTVARFLLAQPSLLGAPELSQRRHELSTWSRWAPFLLDDSAEDVLLVRGRREVDEALDRLRRLDDDHATSVEGIDSLLADLADPDRDVRLAADRAAAERCRSRAPEVARVIEQLARSHAADDAARGIVDWRTRSAVEHGTSVQRMRRVLDAVAAGRPMAHRWYRHRATIVGDQYSDRRSGLATEHRSLPEDVAAVASALSDALPALAPTIRSVVPLVAPGRTNEMTIDPAGTVAITVDHHPTAQARTMVAHEIGHAVHATAAIAAGAGEPPTTLTAETVASWASLACGRRWMTGDTGRVWALALGDQLMDELFLSAAVCEFEDQVQHTVRRGGSVASSDLDLIWRSVLQELHGDAVDVPTWAASGWSRIRAVAIEPGAAFAYVWATVLALAIDDDQAVARLLPLGALDADDLPGHLGLDTDGWVDQGLRRLDRLIDQLITMLAAG